MKCFKAEDFPSVFEKFAVNILDMREKKGQGAALGSQYQNTDV